MLSGTARVKKAGIKKIGVAHTPKTTSQRSKVKQRGKKKKRKREETKGGSGDQRGRGGRRGALRLCGPPCSTATRYTGHVTYAPTGHVTYGPTGHDMVLCRSRHTGPRGHVT
eukprot:3218476-Rhodomonas_salina.1